MSSAAVVKGQKLEKPSTSHHIIIIIILNKQRQNVQRTTTNRFDRFTYMIIDIGYKKYMIIECPKQLLSCSSFVNLWFDISQHGKQQTTTTTTPKTQQSGK